jgi:hypothetical protein
MEQREGEDMNAKQRARDVWRLGFDVGYEEGRGEGVATLFVGMAVGAAGTTALFAVFLWFF